MGNPVSLTKNHFDFMRKKKNLKFQNLITLKTIIFKGFYSKHLDSTAISSILKFLVTYFGKYFSSPLKVLQFKQYQICE